MWDNVGALPKLAAPHAMLGGTSGPALTQISDTVYRADGSPAQGTITLQWPAFTTAAGEAVAAGELSANLGSGGTFNASLAANTGSSPATYYRAIYHLNDDTVQPAWAGEYRVISDFLPVEDVLPGNAVQVTAPLRGASFTAIVREADVHVVSLDDDRSEYTIRFSNDAAALLAFQFETMTLPGPLTTVFTSSGSSSSLYLAPLTAAQVTGVTSTSIAIDAGGAPPLGGGFEVRRTEGGWGLGNDGNLVGRYTTQAFNLPRLSRVQQYYLRQYDALSPARYSRDSALLHVDYPL